MENSLTQVSFTRYHSNGIERLFLYRVYSLLSTSVDTQLIKPKLIQKAFWRYMAVNFILIYLPHSPFYLSQFFALPLSELEASVYFIILYVPALV